MRNWCFTPSGLVHGVLCSVLSDLFSRCWSARSQSPDLWVHCRLDDLIPFCKYAIVPYLLWFPWIPFTLFYLLYKAPRGDFWRLCLPLFTGMTMALLFYAIVPNGLALRPRFVPGSDIFARLVRAIYRSDTPMNVCPSIHVFQLGHADAGLLPQQHFLTRRAAAGCARPPWCCACPSQFPRCCSSSTASLMSYWVCCWP